MGEITAERDPKNEAGDQLPPVMPHTLAVLEYSDFCAVVGTHGELLLARSSIPETEIIEQEHQQLSEAVSQEPQLQSALKDCDYITTRDQRPVVLSTANSRHCSDSAEDRRVHFREPPRWRGTLQSSSSRRMPLGTL